MGFKVLSRGVEFLGQCLYWHGWIIYAVFRERFYGKNVAFDNDSEGAAAVLFINSEESSSYLLIEGIVIYFLYFEFIALIVKYFESGYHFPLRYFIYIGITAIIRLIIVDHKNPIDTLIYAAAILVLVVTLYLANTDRLKRE